MAQLNMCFRIGMFQKLFAELDIEITTDIFFLLGSNSSQNTMETFADKYYDIGANDLKELWDSDLDPVSRPNTLVLTIWSLFQEVQMQRYQTIIIFIGFQIVLKECKSYI